MLLRGLSVTFALMFSTSALSSTLFNGDFSQGADGLDGWTNAGLVDAEVVAGEAVLKSESGGASGPFVTVLVQGDDGEFNFADPITLGTDVTTLKLDFRSSFAADSSESGGSTIDDLLTIKLYDADNLNFDRSFTSGPLNDFDYSDVTTLLAFDVSSLAGRSIALSLEVSDFDNGVDLTAYVDNIRFEGSQVPLPPAAWLFGSALLGLYGVARKKT